MAMTLFEKEVIRQLKGIKDELRKLNGGAAIEISSPMLKVDDIDIGALINHSMRSGERETIYRESN